MAVLEKNGTLLAKDSSGNTVITYPITKAENVDGLEGAIPKQETKTGTLLASGWSSGQYSLESTYLAASYDISIEPNSTCTADQLTAWSEANIVGNATANKVKAFGTIPTVNIPIIIKAVKK